MYEGFRRFDIQTSDPQVTIRGVVGGSGPPALLLHGNPLTHYHWRVVAPRLAVFCHRILLYATLRAMVSKNAHSASPR